MTQLKTTNIKGKQYVEVSERLKHFRQSGDYKGYSLETQIVEVNEKTALMRAIIRDDKGTLLATGTAFERQDAPSSMVNKTSHVENCETSAWGRALGNLGIGIDASVASANEVTNARMNSAVASSPKAASPKMDNPMAGGASADSVRKIASLAKDLGMDVVKDIYSPMKISSSPSQEQAATIITRLEQKLVEKTEADNPTDSK